MAYSISSLNNRSFAISQSEAKKPRVVVLCLQIVSWVVLPPALLFIGRDALHFVCIDWDGLLAEWARILLLDPGPDAL